MQQFMDCNSHHPSPLGVLAEVSGSCSPRTPMLPKIGYHCTRAMMMENVEQIQSNKSWNSLESQLYGSGGSQETILLCHHCICTEPTNGALLGRWALKSPLWRFCIALFKQSHLDLLWLRCCNWFMSCWCITLPLVCPLRIDTVTFSQCPLFAFPQTQVHLRTLCTVLFSPFTRCHQWIFIHTTPNMFLDKGCQI